MNRLQKMSGKPSNTDAFAMFGSLKIYKYVSLVLSITFAFVGLVFLFLPDSVLVFFNSISRLIGVAESPLHDDVFFRVLAVGYMYVVTILAFLMYRHPSERVLLFLLINAKGASAIISVGLFLFHRPYLIYMTNGIVDGFIASVMALFSAKLKGAQS